MKILFCTNKFEEVSNGPAKFANLLLDINNMQTEHELRILTEDISKPNPYVYKLDLRYPASLRLISHYFRIQQYHKEAKRIREEEFPFDRIVYNNAFIGMRSAIIWPETIGMVNDYNNACRKWQYFSFDYAFIKHFLFKQLEYFTVHRLRQTIVNSTFMRAYISKAYQLDQNKISILYKAIQLPDELNQQVIKTDQPIKVLFVKADYLRGGIYILIEAMGSLSYDFDLTVIGPPDQVREKLAAVITTHQNIRLIFKGYQPQAVVQKELLHTHIFCVPAHKEALGVSNLEALSYGVPVVSTDVGGIPEILDDGRNGWMAPADNATALAKCLHTCINDDLSREEKIRNGIQYSRKFRKDKVLKAFISILKEADE